MWEGPLRPDDLQPVPIDRGAGRSQTDSLQISQGWFWFHVVVSSTEFDLVQTRICWESILSPAFSNVSSTGPAPRRVGLPFRRPIGAAHLHVAVVRRRRVGVEDLQGPACPHDRLDGGRCYPGNRDARNPRRYATFLDCGLAIGE